MHVVYYTYIGKDCSDGKNDERILPLEYLMGMFIVYVTNSKMPRMKSHDQHLSGPVHDTGHYIRNGADLGRRDSLLAIWQYPPKIFERFQIFLILANDMLNFFSSSTSHQ